MPSAAVSIMLRDLYTLVTGHMPAPEKAIRLSRIFLVLVIALALLFALTSNDIISYITKMISMIMSGMFICTMLGRFWTRFNWQGAVAALAGGAGHRLRYWWIATGWRSGATRVFRRC
ncbi:Pantothenate:Na+ symporter [Klebsiella pneumoniae]|uniref:Pantothenate:Na+ symporter n=1 Tax=Klebsiella pneumoniae TaxID=573 RepID=A0A377TLV3_KLEPN|nr:Pantothenate:Na+ symporter [Klebsiella pneumoniae]